ncbi:peptidase domain-containing ABC transporter [Aliamphritea spongicola]|uniref:peptidase domain-containing ABC transporter n=1 Tax=Aliamphritea spongicola TaxID=707589 RepID=UPI00196A6374|nr:ABC transporter transmembrane domain-containing protein [Aliamphritea spongicola]MBN3564873.1 ATP-binding cassette domain-containing protein [Aliamphritea spongicola]
MSSLAINILALALPTVILQVYDRIIPNQAIGTFIFLILGMLGVVIIDTALRIFRSSILSWHGAKFDHRESLKAMNRILDADNQAFEDNTAGYYLDKIQALEQIQEFYSGQSVLLIMDLPFVILFLGLIWLIAGPLVAIPIALLVVFLVVAFVTGRKLRKALETRYTMEDRRQNFIIESLKGIHTIKSMAMEALMLRRYEKLQHQSAESVYELSRVNSIVQGIGATFSQLAVVIFVGVGSLFVIEGDLTVGALAAGTMLSSRVLQPGLKAMGFWTQFQSLQLALEKVNQLYALPTESSGELKTEQGLSGKIELREVSFKYPHQENDLLHNLSLTVEPGQAIGITGNNGTGKSTLISLLSGFTQPNEGQILLDDHPMLNYNTEFLRAEIGIMPQKGVLFEGSILENMTLYREGEALEQALELSKILGLEEIVARLPDGLDTQIGGAAVDTLSEGVRQKIIMVRSLVGHPKIILFDDANANFDIKNDNRLLKVIEQMKGKRTMVIVSHRPSFLRLCDKQYQLANGQLEPYIDPYQAQMAARQKQQTSQA